MRFVRLIMVLSLALFAKVAFGQLSGSETNPDRDPAKAVHIFPNPAVEFVSVKISERPIAKMKLTVLNILGNTMETETEVVDEHELRVKVKDLPAGYYFLALRDEETQYRGTFKFLKR